MLAISCSSGLTTQSTLDVFFHDPFLRRFDLSLAAIQAGANFFRRLPELVMRFGWHLFLSEDYQILHDMLD